VKGYIQGKFGDEISGYVAQHIASLPSKYPFASIVVQDVSKTMWDWLYTIAYKLKHRWDEKMMFDEPTS
jgi:hypothetical protein